MVSSKNSVQQKSRNGYKYYVVSGKGVGMKSECMQNSARQLGGRRRPGRDGKAEKNEVLSEKGYHKSIVPPLRGNFGEPSGASKVTMLTDPDDEQSPMLPPSKNLKTGSRLQINGAQSDMTKIQTYDKPGEASFLDHEPTAHNLHLLQNNSMPPLTERERHSSQKKKSGGRLKRNLFLDGDSSNYVTHRESSKVHHTLQNTIYNTPGNQALLDQASSNPSLSYDQRAKQLSKVYGRTD